MKLVQIFSCFQASNQIILRDRFYANNLPSSMRISSLHTSNLHMFEPQKLLNLCQLNPHSRIQVHIPVRAQFAIYRVSGGKLSKYSSTPREMP